MRSFTCFVLCTMLLQFSLHTASHAQTDGYYVSFDSVKIHYQVAGSGKPVLLIHGFTNTGAAWKKKPLYDSLLAAGYQVIVPDLRGNGLSDKPHTPEAYANDAEAKDLQGLLKHLGIQQYKAIGYSRGSIILARLLVLDSNLVTAVMGGMGPDFTNPAWPRRIALYNALISDTAQGFEGLKKRIVTEGLDRLAFAYQQKEQPSTPKEALAKVHQKILVICGNEDTDSDGKALQQLFTNAVYNSVPGDHNTAWGTGAFATAVLAFFNR
ncbi:alpha/beta fold hydrolase [Foetidibacter luteolus]|uniref:alpha/beta fold hydrolase n=1 Tax=Foetidibacter luteolus TaxID=2608880 RepID=UPI00129B56F7|nr:alpha/beta fold hydrolase [Foetidibacter luteolus]